MRFAILTRIFEPEPSAASFRLAALAETISASRHDVEVLTVKPVAGQHSNDEARPYGVRRLPVLRDSAGYVRGYVQYMSFDIPLFFRILFGRTRDMLVVEPPPTTGVFARLGAALRRTPYAYYGADIWSDASASTGAPGFVVKTVRAMERFAFTGAHVVLAVNDGVADRIREIAPKAHVVTIGNGVNTRIFAPGGTELGEGTFAVYTGTASEWQGADVFIRAFAEGDFGDAKLVFLGQGSAWSSLKQLADELGAPVRFVDSVPPEQAAAWLRGAAVSLASIAPGGGYDFAFPTKMFASWGSGTPVIYAGPGPARAVLSENPVLGIGVEHEVEAVRAALVQQFAVTQSHTDEISSWAQQNVSLSSVAERALGAIIDTPTKQRTR
ncbi:MAG: glycosyltransferase [Leucobacter sp.]